MIIHQESHICPYGPPFSSSLFGQVESKLTAVYQFTGRSFLDMTYGTLAYSLINFHSIDYQRLHPSLRQPTLNTKGQEKKKPWITLVTFAQSKWQPIIHSLLTPVKSDSSVWTHRDRCKSKTGPRNKAKRQWNDEMGRNQHRVNKKGPEFPWEKKT